MMNIADNVWRHAESGHPGFALREGDDAWTYEQVREHASWMRRRLEERGVRPSRASPATDSLEPTDKDRRMIRLRQVCLATPNLSDADVLAEILGAPIAYRDPLIIEFGLDNALIGLGGTFVEFIAPLHDGTTATRFLAKHPQGAGYMVIHDTDEYETIRRRIDEQGVRVAWESTPELRGPEKNDPQYAYDSFRLVQLDPRSVGGTLMEFNQTADNEDLFGGYAPAGIHWQEVVPREDVPKIIGAECTTPDPEAMARIWASLMGKAVGNDGGSPAIALDDGSVDRFVEGETSMFTRLFIEADDPDAILERARAAGAPVEGSSFDFCGVRFAVVPRA